MTAMQVIRKALEMGDRAMMMLLEDLKNAPMTSPTSSGGNHPLWVLGHITFVEGNIRRVVLGEDNQVQKWAPLFAAGTEPSSDASKYPPFEEILRTYRELRNYNLQLLDKLGEAGLDQPTKYTPRGLEEALKTAGDTFMTIAMHQMNHRGQLADARRALGRKPIFTPGM